MDLKEARYVLAIAHHKSISKAAEALFISQPSLSKYLKNLESSLNTRLFDRIENCYIPTYIGERYLHYATQIAMLGREWDSEYDDLMHREQGRLSVAIPIMLSNCIIQPTLPKFHALYPNVNINILEDVHFVAEHSIDDSTIDLTFYNVHEFPKNLDYQILWKEEIVLVLRKDHPLLAFAQKKEGFSYPWIDLSRFTNEKFLLLYPDQNTGGIACNLFEEYGIQPDILLHTRNSEMSIHLAMNGVGVAFAPESYFHYLDQQSPEKGTCLSIGERRIENTLIAAHQKGRYLPQYAKVYTDLISDYCREFRKSFQKAPF